MSLKQLLDDANDRSGMLHLMAFVGSISDGVYCSLKIPQII